MIGHLPSTYDFLVPVTNISEIIAISEPLVTDVTEIIAAVPSKKRGRRPLSDEAKA